MALEDALYDSQALRDFVGLDLSRQSVPDATTLLKFRRLLQDNDLTRALFDEINAHRGEQGLLMRVEQLKASVRGKGERPFHVIKNLLRHRKVRYKGPTTNEAQLLSLFGLANLVIAKRWLLALDTRGAP